MSKDKRGPVETGRDNVSAKLRDTHQLTPRRSGVLLQDMRTAPAISFQFAAVQNGDISVLAGVSYNLMKDWRKRGFFGDEMGGGADGWSLYGIAYLLLVYAVTQHGVGPKRCARALRDYARDVMLHALADREAWETEDGWRAWSLMSEQHAPSARFVALDGAGHAQPVDDPAEVRSAGAGVVTIVDLATIGAVLRTRRPRGLARLDPGPPPATGPRVRFEGIPI